MRGTQRNLTGLQLAGARRRRRNDVLGWLVMALAFAGACLGDYRVHGWHTVQSVGFLVVVLSPLWFLLQTLKDANLIPALRRSGMLELVEASPLPPQALVDGIFLYRLAWAAAWSGMAFAGSMFLDSPMLAGLACLFLAFSLLSYPAQCAVIWYDLGAPLATLVRGFLLTSTAVGFGLAWPAAAWVSVVALLAGARWWAVKHLAARPDGSLVRRSGVWLRRGNPILALEFCRWSRRTSPWRRWFGVFGLGLLVVPHLLAHYENGAVVFLTLAAYIVVSWFRVAFTNHRMLGEAKQSGALSLTLTTGVSAAEVVDGFALAAALPRLLETMVLLPVCLWACWAGDWGFQWTLTAVAALILGPLSGGYVARDVVRLSTGSTFWDIVRNLMMTVLASLSIFVGTTLAIVAGANGLFGWFTLVLGLVFVVCNRHQRILALVGSRCPISGLRLQVSQLS